jgi:chitin disaccharide deacetylase
MRPTHFTTHLGTLYSRPDLTEVYLRFAREQWIPAVVIELTPEMVEQFRSQGFPVPDELAATLDSYPLPKVSELRIVSAAESLEEKVAGVVELVETLPPGLTQIAFRPAAHSPALEALTSDWQQRVWEAEVWHNERVQAALGQPGVVVTNWREIMERFEGTSR